jgi:hypothetical protein
MTCLQAVDTSSKSGTSYKVSLDNGTDKEDPVSSTGGPRGQESGVKLTSFPGLCGFSVFLFHSLL